MSQHVYRGIDYSAVVFSEHDFQPTRQQVMNLIDLADVLRKAPPPEFDMGQYGSIQDRVAVEHETGMKVAPGDELTPKQMRKIGIKGPDIGTACGAVACALGTGAYWGIGLVPSSRVNSWDEYGMKVYGVDDNDTFQFLFGGAWSNVDNTPEGAAARILLMMVYGPSALLSQAYLDWEGMAIIREKAKPFLTAPIEPKGATL